MDRQQLNEIKQICQQIRDIYGLLENAYNTYKSPSITREYTKTPGTLADPTAGALDNIEKLSAKLESLLMQRIKFEDWLTSVDDLEVEAAIRWHYIHGLGWWETSQKIYGSGYTKDRSHHKVMRYLDKQKTA